MHTRFRLLGKGATFTYEKKLHKHLKQQYTQKYHILFAVKPHIQGQWSNKFISPAMVLVVSDARPNFGITNFTTRSFYKNVP